MNKLKTLILWILTSLSIGVCGNETGVCGWNEMFDGKLVTASFVMFDTALMGWTIAILFFVFHFMLWLKTRNLTLMWVTGVIFAAMYVTSRAISATGDPILKPISFQIILFILVLELGGILYVWMFK